jgi:exodeoxyribonuclease-3
MSRIRIATYNVNGIRSRLERLLEWLEREAPDIVCLQELKTAESGFPAKALRDAGYRAVYVAQKSWNGVAILARDCEPVVVRRALPGDAADAQGRYIEAAVDGLLVACLYLPNGNPQPGPKFDYKLAWFERLIRHTRGLIDSGHPVVLAGDFNVVPTDSDIYDPRSWLKDALLQPATRDAYRRLLDQGWTDSIRARFPDERVYTFWDYFRQHWPRNAGLRIDHLLLSPSLGNALADAGVDRWVRGRPGASDHAPTWIVLDRAAAKPRTRSKTSTIAAIKPKPRAPASRKRSA